MDTRIGHPFRMEDEIESLYKELNGFLHTNRERIRYDVKQFELEAAKTHLIYAGAPLAIGFYPLILSETQSLYISKVVEAMIRLMERTTDLFLREPRIRQAFGFGPEQIELIEVDPGYERAIPCARFDSFFDGQGLRFSELNTDGTAGMDGSEKIAKLFLAAPTMLEFFSAHPIEVFDINSCVLQTLLDCYGQFAGGSTTEIPRIAIVDWKEARTFEEFVAFEEFCREQGYEAVVADPRELDYDGYVLSHRGLRIDIIYRRVVSGEYFERLKEVKAMTQAFRDHSVCVVGSFRSDVAFSKNIFGVAHDPRFSHFFTSEERKLVEDHVPWTLPFEDSECEYRGRRLSIVELARNEKNRFVLKPSTLYEGRGVMLGVQTGQDEWESLIEAALKNDYILQELIPMPTMPIGLWNNEIEMQTRFIHLGEYVFGGRFCGFYCRAADAPVIDRLSKELLIPCLVLAK
ncbi:MAG: hypothetical protein JSV16_16450 [Candidatus Hydrogenedentota bacterium]|nr:MAG: hypothetical protein JSV16_16450 [Candidatus Hydrogenedentota bacterium]